MALTDGLAIQNLLGLYEMTTPLMESMILDAIADLFNVDRMALVEASEAVTHAAPGAQSRPPNRVSRPTTSHHCCNNRLPRTCAVVA